ncbi:MAG: hypothetical protein U0930_18335 [Pirellulales bacterium]
MAHVIDMHQLTKDPERLLPDWVPSEHSPAMNMTAFELGRYLDYCNELLSLIGKLAAVYVQRFDDEVAIEAVNEVEMLTANLCDRIWQKIMFLNSIETQMKIHQKPETPTDTADSNTAVALPSEIQKSNSSDEKLSVGNITQSNAATD